MRTKDRMGERGRERVGGLGRGEREERSWGSYKEVKTRLKCDQIQCSS